MNGNFENDSELLKIIKEDSLAPQIFYFSFALFFKILFFIYYLFLIKKKFIELIYYEKMKKQFIFGYLFTMLFFVFFFSLKDHYPIILLNVISFFSVTEPINSYILIKEHNKTIKWLNDNNPETLRNYQVHNPLTEHNENVNNSICFKYNK